jgi:hypothetical protein
MRPSEIPRIVEETSRDLKQIIGGRKAERGVPAAATKLHEAVPETVTSIPPPPAAVRRCTSLYPYTKALYIYCLLSGVSGLQA